jgi:hypothetical protein
MPPTDYRIRFTEVTPTPESYWRSIVMFGVNTASYKFALGKALLEVVKTEQEFVPIEVLALPYARAISEHIAHSPRQGSFTKSTFVNSCAQFQTGEIGEKELIAETVKLGFKDVLKAFHKVCGADIPDPFFHVEKRGSNTGLILTPQLIKLSHSIQATNLPHEVESRWRLVETSWEQKVSRNILRLEYDSDDELFCIKDESLRRVEVTSARSGLNAYQKGFCFYCYNDVSIEPKSQNLGQVDHVFPFRLRQERSIPNINGVWNLVLACKQCNGGSGKRDKIPSRYYLERLFHRNEYLIESRHPLGQYIAEQTGSSQEARRQTMQKCFDTAKLSIHHEWTTKAVREAAF